MINIKMHGSDGEPVIMAVGYSGRSADLTRSTNLLSAKSFVLWSAILRVCSTLALD